MSSLVEIGTMVVEKKIIDFYDFLLSSPGLVNQVWNTFQFRLLKFITAVTVIERSYRIQEVRIRTPAARDVKVMKTGSSID